MEHRTAPKAGGDFAIWIHPAADGGQSWELLNTGGERVMHGQAGDQAEALAMARTAVESLKRPSA